MKRYEIGVALFACFVIAGASLRICRVVEERFKPASSCIDDEVKLQEKTCTVTLSLANEKKCPAAFVLCNGKVVGQFYEKTITTNVPEGALLEVDGTQITEPFYVDVTVYNQQKQEDKKRIWINHSIEAVTFIR